MEEKVTGVAQFCGTAYRTKKTIAQYPEAQLVALKGQNSGKVGVEGLKRDFVSETTQKWLRMSIMDLGLEKKNQKWTPRTPNL